MLLRALAATQRSPFLSRGLIRRSLISRSVATREMVEEESRQTESLSTESSLLTPQHRPIYHLQPRSAWLNDRECHLGLRHVRPIKWQPPHTAAPLRQ